MKLTEKQRNGIRLALDAILSFALVVTGILFIYSCYTIYKSGPSPFTRESIAAAFSKIAPAVYITLGTVIIAGVIDIVLSKEVKKLTGARSPKVLVSRLAARVDLDGTDSELKLKIEKERRLRKNLRIVRLSVNLACLILPLIHIFNPANYPATNTNSEVLSAFLVYLALLSPAIVFEIVHIILAERSYTKEAEYLKAAPKLMGKENNTVTDSSLIGKIKAFFNRNERDLLLGIRIALTVCAVVFIAIGIFGGGMLDVLNKAIKICTECIGLG